ncbi:hypothetical protein BT96DRAFT_922496 [Gymnopus androsaceus JB14]|uniref:Uncharacterized protein n=1 Tax=Gymnopus androsaceus JB14 TaxID=1447944 RepID=A0A6A4HDS1_9AGAR|nr:hypothetical protein BT96DRAFT_922496 [Gymnopus androsaceus JB14]
MHQSAKSPEQFLRSKTFDSLKLSRHTTTESLQHLICSETLTPKQEQERKRSAISKLRKRVIDAYIKRASRTNIPVGVLYGYQA